MKTAAFLFCGLLFIAFCSCKQKPAAIAEQAIEAKDTITFYPITDFISQQLAHIDSTPYFLYRIRFTDGKKDSTTIDKKIFDSLAATFTRFNISDSTIQKKYTETIFNDQSTDSYTMSYRTTDGSLPLQSVDVLLNRDNQQVKRIFWVIRYTKEGNAITEKAGWKANRNFYINRTIQQPDGKETAEQNTVVWNDKD